jgi:Mg2+ and Co2+ transporter CorA
MCGVPRYIGRWITDSTAQSTTGAGWKMMDHLTCQGTCCKRRNGGYEALAQDEEDAKDNFDEEIDESVFLEDDATADAEGEVATDEAESCCTFERCFDRTLQALENQNSLLRTGDNLQLMTRMMLNNSQKYLEVANLYDAALARLRWLLNKPQMPNKDIFIDKVERARRELSVLLRIVTPFQIYVMPSLLKIGEEFPDSVSDHQIKELVNNMNTFMPKLKSSMDMCESLTSMYDRDASDRMNTVLNILTFITFVITPMQLMTGLYGMNFRIIPELNWTYGYHYFWATSLTLSFCFALLLYYFTREN